MGVFYELWILEKLGFVQHHGLGQDDIVPDLRSVPIRIFFRICWIIDCGDHIYWNSVLSACKYGR